MKTLFACFAASTIVVAVPAAATDFTLDVPVHITNMPRVTRGYVECLISTEPLGGDRFLSTNVIGRNSVFFTVTGGTFDGTVTVPVENTSSRASRAARSYNCQLFGEVLNDSGSSIALDAPSRWSGYETVTHIPIDRATTTINANLP